MKRWVREEGRFFQTPFCHPISTDAGELRLEVSNLQRTIFMRSQNPAIPLTRRQNQILHLVQQGYSNKEVARVLNISEGTVKQHLFEIYRRLNVTNRTMAAEVGRNAEDGSLFLPQSGGRRGAISGKKKAMPPPLPAFPRFTAAIQPVTIVRVEIQSSETLVNTLGSHGFARFNHFFREICRQESQRFGGVLQGLPDGLLLLFGVPHLREDDCERAACCANRIFDRVQRIGRKELVTMEIPARVCVFTGELVTNSDGDKLTLHGAQLLHACPRLREHGQELATPWMDEATRNALVFLAGRYGQAYLSQRLAVDATPPAPVFPFRGRKTELATLHGYRDRLLQGNSQAAILLGEAGFGKTRLVEVLRQETTQGKHIRWLVGGCRPSGRHFPFHPLVPVLEQLAGATHPPSPLVSPLERLLAWTATLGEPLTSLGNALLAALEAPEGSTGSGVEASLIDAAAEFISKVVRLDPVRTILFLDNLQWADATTLALLPRLVEKFDGSFVWLLGAGRKAELRQLPTTARMQPVALSKLNARVIIDLLRSSLSHSSVSDEFLLRLSRWCRGVPLFAREMVQHLRQLTGESIETLPEERLFPPALQGLILERLHDAGIDWRTARAIAAMETVTENQLLALELHSDPGTTKVAMARLLQVGLVETSGLRSNPTLKFTNGMIRAAIWRTLPEGDRQS
ncbi:MAG: AAA family ATPase [Magnetococcales bacterium]|nr:AAA family ATPase [Magnetococcales bacterium]